MLHFLASAKVASFVGGAVVGVVAGPILKSKVVHSTAVTALSKGILMKNAVEEKICNIREEAEDLCAEAYLKAQSEADTAE